MLEMFEFLEVNFQQVIASKQSRFDEINQLYIIRENEIV